MTSFDGTQGRAVQTSQTDLPQSSSGLGPSFAVSKSTAALTLLNYNFTTRWPVLRVVSVIFAARSVLWKNEIQIVPFRAMTPLVVHR
jgi:hypothetical protein